MARIKFVLNERRLALIEAQKQVREAVPAPEPGQIGVSLRRQLLMNRLPRLPHRLESQTSQAFVQCSSTLRVADSSPFHHLHYVIVSFSTNLSAFPTCVFFSRAPPAVQGAGNSAFH